MNHKIFIVIVVTIIATGFAVDSGTQKEYTNAQNLDFTGDGVTVGVGEASIPYMEHPTLLKTTYYNDHSGTVPDDHATSVTGVIVSDSDDGRYQGLAPGANIVLAYQKDIWKNTRRYYRDYLMVATNNSYVTGLAPASFYSTDAYDIDLISYVFPEVLHVTGAGNNGSKPYGGIQAGKNVLNVGNLNHDRTRYKTSTTGFLYDNRIYTHIMAMGMDVRGPAATKDYKSMSGTSQAAPVITACVAILTEAMGGPQMAAAIKAILMNTAKDVPPKGPDMHTGYGTVDVSEAIRYKDNLISGHMVSQGDTNNHRIVLQRRQAAKVMLTWMDLPAQTFSEDRALWIDLDLRVNDKLPHVAAMDPTENSYRTVDSIHTFEQCRPPADTVLNIQVIGVTVPVGTRYYVHWR